MRPHAGLREEVCTRVTSLAAGRCRVKSMGVDPLSALRGTQKRLRNYEGDRTSCLGVRYLALIFSLPLAT